MTVYFIGAGPGDPELITVKGKRFISSCPVCIYAGSLVPEPIIEYAQKDALVVDSANLTLQEILSLMVEAHNDNKDVARVHSGDPSLYGAIAEQIERLKQLGIDYEIIPGVPAFSAAAARMGQELTIPEVAQTLIITRTSMKSTTMPQGENLENLAKSKATLAIHLSVRNSLYIQRQLIPHYGEHCPAVIAYRVGWPDEIIIRTTLRDLRDKIREAKITRTALIFVGSALQINNIKESALYHEDHQHILRHRKVKSLS